MFKSTFVALFALVSLISAQTQPIVSITSPLAKQSYTAGGQAIISWIDPKVDTIPIITLSKGASTALQPVTEVAKNVNAKDGQYKWTIPANIPAGDDYAFVLGSSPNLAYTGQFTIKAADGTQPPASSSSSGSGSGSGSSSGSGSTSPSASGSSAGSSSSPSNQHSAGNKVASPLALSVMIVVGVAMTLF
ncbi:unnamed protein product [Cunninghamella blakesleeana]